LSVQRAIYDSKMCCCSPHHEALPCLSAGDGQVVVFKKKLIIFLKDDKQLIRGSETAME